jgi:hypothetical protein
MAMLSDVAKDDVAKDTARRVLVGQPRRMAKLHFPPGERYFGTRKGYAVTYVECHQGR